MGMYIPSCSSSHETVCLRFLQQSSELDGALAKVEANEEKNKKRKRRNKAAKIEPEQSVDLLQLHIQNLLGMDRSISKLGATSQDSLNRVADKQQSINKKRLKLRKKADGGIGNSRSSSSRNSKLKQDPTFDKKQAEALKQKKTLEDIGKMLKNMKQKKSKSK